MKKQFIQGSILAVIAATSLILTSTAFAATSSDASSTNSTSQSQTQYSTAAKATRHQLGFSGTVTAVGTASVTIKTSSDEKSYAVDTSSDIDKSGDASLSDLVVGDVVKFCTVTKNGQEYIAILHTGDETKNMPQGGGGRGNSVMSTLTTEQQTAVKTAFDNSKTSALASLVSAGTITQAQADTIAAHVKGTQDTTITTAQHDAIRTAMDSVRKTAVDKLVSAGTITQAIADQLSRGGHGGRGGGAKVTTTTQTTTT